MNDVGRDFKGLAQNDSAVLLQRSDPCSQPLPQSEGHFPLHIGLNGDDGVQKFYPLLLEDLTYVHINCTIVSREMENELRRRYLGNHCGARQ
jgi:hypothetical protein